MVQFVSPRPLGEADLGYLRIFVVEQLAIARKEAQDLAAAKSKAAFPIVLPRSFGSDFPFAK